MIHAYSMPSKTPSTCSFWHAMAWIMHGSTCMGGPCMKKEHGHHEASYRSHFGHEGAEQNYVQEVAHGVRHQPDSLGYGLHVWTNLKYDVTYNPYDVMVFLFFHAVTGHNLLETKKSYFVHTAVFMLNFSLS